MIVQNCWKQAHGITGKAAEGCSFKHNHTFKDSCWQAQKKYEYQERFAQVHTAHVLTSWKARQTRCLSWTSWTVSFRYNALQYKSYSKWAFHPYKISWNVFYTILQERHFWSILRTTPLDYSHPSRSYGEANCHLVGHDMDVRRQSFDCSEARAVQLLHGWMFSWLIETKKQIQASLSRNCCVCRFSCRNVLVQALLYDWSWLFLMHLLQPQVSRVHRTLIWLAWNQWGDGFQCDLLLTIGKGVVVVSVDGREKPQLANINKSHQISRNINKTTNSQSTGFNWKVLNHVESQVIA